MKYDIFVSYSRKDSKIVQAIVGRLEARGCRCLMDMPYIDLGFAVKNTIINAIRESSVILFFSSVAANKSEYILREIKLREIQNAVELGKEIIPVKLDDAPYADSLTFLSQYVDILLDPGHRSSADIDCLVGQILNRVVMLGHDNDDLLARIAKPQPRWGIMGLVAAIRTWFTPRKAIGGTKQHKDQPVIAHKIGNSEVKVVVGDICMSKCEVIVSSDDSRLSQGGGVSYMIAHSGGDDIQRHIKNLVPVDLGDVAVTTAGNLQQKYIFHAVTIDLEKTRIVDEALQDFIVRNSVRRCFQLVSMLKLSSIAFPVIGAGAAGIPVERACRRMAEMFVEELGKTNRGLSIELWLFDEAMDMADSILDDVVKSVTKHVGQPFSMPMDNIPKVSEMQSSVSVISPEPYSECPDDGSSREVFICYSRKDDKMSDWVCGVLRAAGISYWRDVDGIYSGQNFKGVIVRAIRASHTVFFLSSKSSNASENVIGEVGAALHFGKHVVPIKLDATEYHDNLLLDMLNLDNIDVAYLGMARAADKICKVALLNRANSGVRENLQD